MKIYTITCSNAYNYGAVLQAYAFQKFLEMQGHEVEIIDYYPSYLRSISDKYKKIPGISILRKILYAPDYYKSEKVFSRFKLKYLKLTEPCYGKKDILNLRKPDVYIVGSDQVWNPYMSGNGTDENYYLNFGKVNKIAYAASIGCEHVEDKYIELYKKYLIDFKFVSVREEHSLQILKKAGIDAEHVIDPVYLLSQLEWAKISKELVEEKFVLVYALHHVQKIYDYAHKLAAICNAKVYIVSVELKEIRRGGDRFFWNVDVDDFVGLIKGSVAVVSNSFHGLSMGLIFNKPIHIFDTESNDIRINNLVNMFELQERIVGENNYLLANDIVKGTLENIEREKSKSIKMLNEVLAKIECYE